MSIRSIRRVLIMFAGAAASTALNAQSTVPIRELSSPEVTSTDQFGGILGLRELSTGKLLMNDGRRRQVWILDASLATKTIVLDSVSSGGRGYGRRASPIIRYLGDSTLFVDAESRSVVVLGPDASVARVAAPPNPNDMFGLAYATSGIDAKGNLIYRVQAPLEANPKNECSIAPGDSARIVRADFETRSIDTLARVKTRKTSRSAGKLTGETCVDTTFRIPISTFDEWTILSDGTIALVRGHDYHIDIVRPDGSKLSGPKLPFDWKRLTDADKQALVDSARKAREAIESDPNAEPMYVSAASLAAAANGAPRPTIGNQPKRNIREIPASEVEDYWPPIREDAVKADVDGNAWILPSTSAQSKNGELVYDVVNNRGIMTHRVRMPIGRSIAGFGKGGVVYLMHGDSKSGFAIERVRVEEVKK